MIMRVSVTIFAVFTLLRNADSAQPLPYLDSVEAQNMLIHLALNDNALGFARGDAVSKFDICTWTAISCIDSLVAAISMRIPYSDDKKSSVEAEWLPPTIQFFHLENSKQTKRSSLNYLPRDLRYLYRYRSYDETYRIDCARLPCNMEELILVKTTLAREIRLDGIPKTMRYLYINQSSLFTDSIFVNYNTLPLSIEEMWVTSAYKANKMKRKIRAIGNPGAVRLQTRYDYQCPKNGSNYLDMFQWGNFKKIDWCNI